jgi:hypothetical protein
MALEEPGNNDQVLASNCYGKDPPLAYAANMINDAALLHMTRAEYDQAIEILTATLKLLANKMRVETKFETICQARSSPNPRLRFASESKDLFLEPPQVNLGPQKIFRSPICIQNGTELLPGTSTYESLSFVVVYNLALAWHLKSVMFATDEASKTSMLRKALALYEHTTKIMSNGTLSGDPLPYMALACNMGALCLDLGCTQRFRACQSALLSTILCCVDGEYTTSNWDLLLDGFLSNASHGVFVMITAPAA